MSPYKWQDADGESTASSLGQPQNEEQSWRRRIAGFSAHLKSPFQHANHSQAQVQELGHWESLFETIYHAA